MWRCVHLALTDVSEESIADAGSPLVNFSTLKMEAIRHSSTIFLSDSSFTMGDINKNGHAKFVAPLPDPLKTLVFLKLFYEVNIFILADDAHDRHEISETDFWSPLIIALLKHKKVPCKSEFLTSFQVLLIFFKSISEGGVNLGPPGSLATDWPIVSARVIMTIEYLV
jgi:hypothetical protein